MEISEERLRQDCSGQLFGACQKQNDAIAQDQAKARAMGFWGKQFG